MFLKKIKLIKNLCKDKNLNISLAESCTGGLLSALFTQVPGSSEFFDSSYIVYSNKSKINSLGVSSAIIKKYGSVSKNTSLDMAKSFAVPKDGMSAFRNVRDITQFPNMSLADDLN